MNDIVILETIYAFLIIVLVSVVLPILIYCPIKFCADKFEKAQHKAYVKSHLKYIWFELYKKYGQDIGLARCFDNFCRTNSLHCFYKNGILFWQKEYTEKLDGRLSCSMDLVEEAIPIPKNGLLRLNLMKLLKKFYQIYCLCHFMIDLKLVFLRTINFLKIKNLTTLTN